MSKTVKEHLISALANGDFVSGQEIADQLGVSRAAISNQMKALTQMGLDIFKVRGKGYQLANPIVLLDRNIIQQALLQLDQENVVEVHNLIDSTNDYLMRKLPNNIEHGQVCLAEYQSAGRGRRGRAWQSPFGSHLYLSYYSYLAQGMSAAMGLSLLTAIALSDAIKDLYKIDVQLKWPNDIYLNGVKLAGILIDLEGQASGACHCVIGVGLNLKMPEHAANEIDQPWTDLQSHLEQSIDRNILAASIIEKLNSRLLEQQQSGLSEMVKRWHELDYYLNKEVKLITGNNSDIGVCRGIDNQGALLLEKAGEIFTIYGGEVSLRGLDASTR